MYQRSLNTIEIRKQHFLELAHAKYGDRFDYSNVVYITNSIPVTIVCKIHGEFKQRPAGHLTCKEGCYKCGKDRAGFNHRFTTEEFIKEANEIHNYEYDYSRSTYVGAFIKIEIICNKHGPFLQQPNSHLFHKSGCERCALERNISKGEKFIADILTNMGEEFTQQFTFDDLKANDGKNKLRFDFYLHNRNVLIELDGPHHHSPIAYRGTTKEAAKKTHEMTVFYDNKKNEYVKEKGIRLIRIPYIRHYSKLKKELQIRLSE